MTDAASRGASAPALAVIPARYASTRLPGKPLLDRTGRPLIAHVIERVTRARTIGRVIVATDDARIAKAATRAGAEARLTRDDHANGTSRIAEVVEQLAEEDRGLPDLVVNVQGDEPEVEPAHVDKLVDELASAPDVPMATLAAAWDASIDPADPNVVKVVVSAQGDALYFSRSPVPFDRDGVGVGRLHHVGLYAYRRAFLGRFVALPPTPHERAERLEQLRALEHGHRIRVAVVDRARPGIDTPEQYAAFVERVRGGQSAD